jgi:DNA-directed RNA polymerase subunit RPC12/RpoP
MAQYKCQKCQKEFEKETSCCSEDTPSCPACGSKEVKEVQKPADINEILRSFFVRRG